MKELAKAINERWNKFKDRCEYYIPESELTEEWCNNNQNRSAIFALNLGSVQ
jgi:hypothetical protein